MLSGLIAENIFLYKAVTCGGQTVGSRFGVCEVDVNFIADLGYFRKAFKYFTHCFYDVNNYRPFLAAIAAAPLKICSL